MFRRKPELFLRLVASTLLASLLVVLTLAANPRWHELAHAAEHCEHGQDEEHGEHRPHEEHSCVVDLFTAGAVDRAAPVSMAPAPPIVPKALSFTTTTEFVASIFLSGSILEHAPPA